ncbi:MULTISPECIES: serine/threonine-protein kinase [unclassified Iodobacter]|uniref:serine/threonine protein kinase n=1 Tax=unclassified Iodobacter TaxID=235634 RepID=UPI0025CD8EB6|nr:MULTISPECIES: serine/threonine-protein kinase [unclassified Iodobacter]MDW5415245.1 serine/threonine-protein kinase [Iodobacter sp. CM08]
MATPSNQPLARGYQLQNYTIAKLLSAGGFSIVYLAHDENDYPVAIKEYLPNSLALRTEGDVVQARSEDSIALFRHGLKCFFEEGKTLAHIQHPNIIRVRNFFRANDTVYMVMEYERGRTLQKEIQLKHGREGVDEGLIRHVFYHLLNGLREVHLNKLLHLDIKPANIYIRKDGSPVLLDFGSARQTLALEQSKLTPMYTPGFAAPEQYNKKDPHGPWTDIYGIGASLFACIAGTAPQPADLRLKEDKVIKLHDRYGDRYSPELIELISLCLSLDPSLRPQSVPQLQKQLLERGSAPLKRSGIVSTLRRKWVEFSNKGQLETE